MNSQHDPYLTTVKISLDEQRILERKNRLKLKRENRKKENFFSKKININQIIDLPNGIQQIVLLIFFTFMPYSVGLLFIFVTSLDIRCFNTFNLKDFLFFWTIGYEFLATILLIFLVQQSFVYRRSP